MFAVLFVWPENALRFIVNLEAAELWKKFLAKFTKLLFLDIPLKGRETQFLFILLLSPGLFHVYIGKRKTALHWQTQNRLKEEKFFPRN